MDSCPDTDIGPSPLGSSWLLAFRLMGPKRDTDIQNRTLVSQIGLLCPKSDTSV